MGDRRMGDRREKEKGIIRVKTKDAIIYLAIAFLIIIQISANIILFIQNREYKEVIEFLSEGDYINEEYDDNDDYYYDDDYDSDEYDEDIQE